MKPFFFATILLSSYAFGQNTFVPDDNFEQALIDLGFDTGPLNDSVPTDNINTVTSLVLGFKDIDDLTGIEDFVALEVLLCPENNLDSLNLSENTALIELECWSNSIQTLDITGLTALGQIDCSYNSLDSIDLSTNTSLIEINASVNNLEVLDLSSNLNLEEIECNINSLTTLLLPATSTLEVIRCSVNELDSIDLSVANGLRQFICSSNHFTLFDLSENTDLEMLLCGNNEILTLDLSNNTALEILSCTQNNIEILDLSSNIQIRDLRCGENPISSVNLENCEQLLNVYGANAQFSELDFSDKPLLNQLDLSNNPSLAKLNVKNGNNMAFSPFNVEGCTLLSCITVDDPTFSEENWTAIDEGLVFSLDCETLKIEENNLAFRIYPTHVISTFNVEISQEGELEILDLNARSVLKTTLIKGNNSIDCTKLEEGLYLVKINNQNTQRIIKQ